VVSGWLRLRGSGIFLLSYGTRPRHAVVRSHVREKARPGRPRVLGSRLAFVMRKQDCDARKDFHPMTMSAMFFQTPAAQYLGFVKHQLDSVPPPTRPWDAARLRPDHVPDHAGAARKSEYFGEKITRGGDIDDISANKTGGARDHGSHQPESAVQVFRVLYRAVRLGMPVGG